jgi:hypothetical protein
MTKRQGESSHHDRPRLPPTFPNGPGGPGPYDPLPWLWQEIQRLLLWLRERILFKKMHEGHRTMRQYVRYDLG